MEDSESINILGKNLTIDSFAICHNGNTMQLDQLTGIRFGVSYMNVNRAAVFGSYTVGIKDRTKEVKIECKNNWTNDSDALMLFDNVVSLIRRYAVPVLSRTLAANIANGKPVVLGDTKLSHDGVYIQTGKLLWKSENVVPWSDLGFKLWGDGYEQFIVLFSISNRKIAVAHNRRNAWNASIFPDIALKLAPLVGVEKIRQLQRNE